MTCSKGRRVAALILVHVLPGELQGPYVGQPFSHSQPVFLISRLPLLLLTWLNLLN